MLRGAKHVIRRRDLARAGWRGPARAPAYESAARKRIRRRRFRRCSTGARNREAAHNLAIFGRWSIRSQLIALALAVALPEGVIAGVLDRDGRFLMRSMEPEKWVGTQGRLPGLPESFWSEREGFVQVRGVDGIARIYAFTTIAGAGWRVFAGIPEDVVYRPHRRRLAWTVSLGALALLAAVTAALGVGRAIAEPIRRLETAAAAIAGGEPAARAEEDGATEIARVAQEFNRMLEARRHAEQDQQDLSRRIAAILEGMSDAFVAFDREWRYTYVNARAAELFARSADSLIGRNYYTEYPEAAGTPFEQAYRRAMDERVPVFIEERYAPWDRWFENRIFPTADGIAVFFHEITERKRAEARIGQQLDELRRWYEATLGREDRVRELKREVNELRARLGEAPHYAESPADAGRTERSGT